MGPEVCALQNDSCESKMNDVRSSISKIFNGAPRSYTRFNLTRNMEGDGSQVEMKLSSDVDEETDHPAGERQGNGYGQPHDATYVQKLGHSPRNVCFMIVATLLVFAIGYLIGYLADHRQDKECSELPLSDDPVSEERVLPVEEEIVLDWSDLKALLKEKLNENSLQAAFKEFSLAAHEAGSEGDRSLASRVHERFKSYDMSPWTDNHYVKLQGPPRTGNNRVSFAGEEIGRPQAYLAYSATGTVQGNLVYAYYGEPGDFQIAQNFKAQLNGSVVLLRAGKISFAEKVANAAKMKAAAVLIYPDPADYSIETNTELYGHVHLGTGDPYTPGFPSFNHTQFPPVKSSGLPEIPAQTITASMATKLFGKMTGISAPGNWEGKLGVNYKIGGDGDVVTVEVNNVPTEKKITNVFGVIMGVVDPDRYLVIGAQRDSWGPGFARSTVGTSLLVELARVISDMEKNDGFVPRRSIIFASWSAGEYGSVGATEWLEGYLSSMNLKAFSYISLDGVVAGSDSIKASASPLLYTLFEGALKEVIFPLQVNSPTTGQTLYAQVGGEKSVMVPMKMDDTAYPFLAFSGIPSISFRFTDTVDYPYFGTLLDTENKLSTATRTRPARIAVAAGQVAGQMALRLVHDHLLKLDLLGYDGVIRKNVAKLHRQLYLLKQSKILPETLTSQWLTSAAGSYGRASSGLHTDIRNSDLVDVERCRVLNDRIMRVEKNLLSPYENVKETPFRHIIFGSGAHTLPAILEHLKALRDHSPETEVDFFRNQFALVTWTIQGCANALAGDIWVLNREE
ncbi:transferrin receptor protein 1-like isoform X4 [Anguilla anguilla]|uniref:transferrin receptor protein 1-like isoform X4 n=1 Tax=Anguilla anguilla TaxID=7936 RepID=UPI0015A88455|nr:transferrin receptor protein 1-like isoform X4 [Anguilla anguilla]